MHATLEKFHYPDSLIREYEHWCVLLRPAQVTLGSLVLVNRSQDTAFSALSAGAFAEMQRVIVNIEQALKSRFAYDKINYLMLMMVDPQVHCHIIPRYEKPRAFGGVDYTDTAWPKPPLLSDALAMPETDWQALLADFRQHWPKA